jgi:hypothetical protein
VSRAANIQRLTVSKNAAVMSHSATLVSPDKARYCEQKGPLRSMFLRCKEGFYCSNAAKHVKRMWFVITTVSGTCRMPCSQAVALDVGEARPLEVDSGTALGRGGPRAITCLWFQLWCARAFCQTVLRTPLSTAWF